MTSQRGRLALQPLIGIGDGSTVGYEVLYRSPAGVSSPTAAFERVLEVVSAVNPATLIVPADETLFSELGEELAVLTAAAGVLPAELVWLLPDRPPDRWNIPLLERAHWLSEMGFGLALDAMDVASLADAEVAELHPAFAMLRGDLTRRVLSEVRARAEVAALMSYFARLGTRTVARRVDDEHAARLWIELGLQLGVGAYLQPPIVLDAGAAEPGDEVVNPNLRRYRQAPAS